MPPVGDGCRPISPDETTGRQVASILSAQRRCVGDSARRASSGTSILWRHPVLGRNKAWWWAGGIWSVLFALAAVNDDEGKKPSADSPAVARANADAVGGNPDLSATSPSPAAPIVEVADEAEQEQIAAFETWVSLSAKDRQRAAEFMPIDAAFRRQSGSYDPEMQPLLHRGLLSQLHEQTKRIIAETFEITLEELDAIIEEGKEKRWPEAESLGGS